ncbi:hypothetical protein OOK60_17235 [Trichothermofontia sichuanensis B231]|uniref:hypothetical protein n=1 Tax=Trichothermofontia sichuanensis TaxID=3045816 RepID=UPI0022456051|nr:hypothetical protein [Trichothermofontia sichuanensis]UZQ54204.1 hypothetical protein OOK60_17235 [Trichothermofontia sichuanensis B231]
MAEIQKHVEKLIQVAQSGDEVSLIHSVTWLHDRRFNAEDAVGIVVEASVALLHHGQKAQARQLLERFLADAAPELVAKTKTRLQQLILQQEAATQARAS